MYEHIVVALDETQRDEGLLPHVEALASKFGSRVSLIHVVTTGQIAVRSGAVLAGDPSAVGLVDPTPAVEELAASTRTYLEGVTQQLQDRGLKVDWTALEGSATEQIVAYARQEKADLIVMSTHARGGIGRFILGSVADSVLRHSPCPVLHVRTQYRPAGREGAT